MLFRSMTLKSFAYIFLMAGCMQTVHAQSVCVFTKNHNPQSIGNATPLAHSTVNAVLNSLGFSINTIPVYQGNVGNALASRSPTRIIYDPNFLHQLALSGGNIAPATAVLAHEVGHIVGGSQGSSSSHVRELEADCISGVAMRNLGYSESQAVQVQFLIPSSGSVSHPGSNDRVSSILRGYRTNNCQ